MSDALIELEALLPQIGPAVDRRRFGESLGRTADLLREATRHIERLTAILEIAHETGFAREAGHADALLHLNEAADEAANRMLTAASPNDLREVQEGYKDFVQELGRAETQLRRHWRVVVERDFRPLTVIGQLLRDIETTSDVGRRFIDCGEAAERSGNNAGAVDVWRDTVARLRQQQAALEAERHTLTRNVEVDAFLDALADGRATLRHITPGVRDWLERNHALDGFAVSSRI